MMMGGGGLIWIIIIIGAFFMFNNNNFRGKNCSSRNVTKSKTSLEILEERYARGEIDKEEFIERKNNLLN
ncbi:SHOCT domain-containing protein [Selenihalanaerobacter shriftii]|uniref:Putative membrane protein n=1 Tax=Selenihalanaerobacter shriftii TaxID=142842 RepID=A0A1T4JML7_9FIRM|nr:SHOCT domain-containing protein [Selenihalanaerobacter shriftii]SJZ31403.1 putative membrane protein [Selenihalanaerobacter shriftii]